MDMFAVSTEDAIMDALLLGGKFSEVTPIDGGMNGYSFKAMNSNVGRVVFLKVVDLVAEARSDILSEIRCIATVTAEEGARRNIVEVYDGDCLNIGKDEFVYFQMEFVDGPSLGNKIEAGELGQQDAVRIASAILNGLGYLHQANILHRDLKPHNIMLTNNTPKVSDFGSAVCLQQGHTSVSASRHSALYVPPEGWGSPSLYTFQSDIYQIGVVLYEMVNGCLEYEPSHYLTPAIKRQIASGAAQWKSLGDYEKCERINESLFERAKKRTLLSHGRIAQPYLSPKLSKIIAKATSPKLEDRYSTALAFMAALQQMSLPNWLAVSGEEFLSAGWRGYDWQLRRFNRPRSSACELRKCKPGTEAYRCIKTPKFATIESAFDFVEKGGRV